MTAKDWLRLTFRQERERCDFLQRFECSRMSPAMLEAALEDGWRHHGSLFFRDMFGVVDNYMVLVVPLRIRVEEFVPSKSQRRVLRRNAALRVEFGDAQIDPFREELFRQHAERFSENKPEALRDFIGDEPACIPSTMMECRVYRGNTLIAVSYFDRTQRSVSSIYAMFAPQETHSSLGTFTILAEIEYARLHNLDFVYLGYAHAVSSYYDYKKRFAATEFYNWQGEWLDFRYFRELRPPEHVLEMLDLRQFNTSAQEDGRPPEAGKGI